MMTMRTSKILRETKETKIIIELGLDGEGEPKREIKTGIGFLDHMFDLSILLDYRFFVTRSKITESS